MVAERTAEEHKRWRELREEEKRRAQEERAEQEELERQKEERTRKLLNNMTVGADNRENTVYPTSEAVQTYTVNSSKASADILTQVNQPVQERKIEKTEHKSHKNAEVYSPFAMNPDFMVKPDNVIAKEKQAVAEKSDMHEIHLSELDIDIDERSSKNEDEKTVKISADPITFDETIYEKKKKNIDHSMNDEQDDLHEEDKIADEDNTDDLVEITDEDIYFNHQPKDDYDDDEIIGVIPKTVSAKDEKKAEETVRKNKINSSRPESAMKKEELRKEKKAEKDSENESEKEIEKIIKGSLEEEDETEYEFPPVDLLNIPKTVQLDSPASLQVTASKLVDTLASFGVNVRMTDIIQGPTVTRYEMQPQQGVKVSKILSLIDDIKLSLAATDIRIEAPIPGKAAIGIEVPNKVNATVSLKELVDTDEFRKAKSKLSFAVGKNIGGEPVIFDIAKMPHLLIAGATGSGKSVCINTIIMSILYKAKPDEVKMIMIDPKVVELSVYNGLPHLLSPVVTDPQKASGALKWGVAEMTRRYRLFADLKVRDMKGYNNKVDKFNDIGELDEDGNPYKKMPQILIIVDELADLMMVAKNEVETSICRLTQLARAAGIHLIIATQRPSVDVITGLIKANMPSRIAFAVSSGVDSRTILDMNGAERLLGKGDMLFYPQSFNKPERVQGTFVSDDEVQEVVDFILDEMQESGFEEEDISSEIEAAAANDPGKNNDSDSKKKSKDDDRDEYFEDAGRFIIEKNKASIGMLQRVFKIGFNRAARIMDSLAEAGVVSGEDGTKARTILMNAEQFEAYLSGDDIPLEDENYEEYDDNEAEDGYNVDGDM
ncbi:MAG: DNA translocase FtsK [Lachnospiraceae bacterium]|nr:DNA translocase FtsK [Lachnospiraceae bacterium]